MPSTVELDKISTAIHDCLDIYRPDRPRLRQVAKHFKRLRATPGWTEDEVAQVKRAVRRTLAVLAAAGWIS